MKELREDSGMKKYLKMKDEHDTYKEWTMTNCQTEHDRQKSEAKEED